MLVVSQVYKYKHKYLGGNLTFQTLTFNQDHSGVKQVSNQSEFCQLLHNTCHYCTSGHILSCRHVLKRA